jgi:putative membrane protein
MGWGGWVAVTFAMVAFWALIAIAVVLALRSHRHGHRHATAPEPAATNVALHLLDERLARGEMDADEYSRRRQLLTAR